MCLSVSIPHMCGCLGQPKDGVGSSGSGVRNSHEPPGMGAGTQTWMLRKGSKHS